MRAAMRRSRLGHDGSAIAHAGSAINFRVSVHDLSPWSAIRHTHAVGVARNRCHIAQHQHAAIPVVAKERKDTVFDVVADYPCEALRIKVPSMQGGMPTIDIIQVANDLS